MLPPLLVATLSRPRDPPHVAPAHARFSSEAAQLGTDADTMAAMSTLLQPCTGGLEARILTALTEHKEGAAVIIGANTGAVFTDPSFGALNSSACAHLEKIFVEPIPSLFHALERNIRQMAGARAVQAAVTDDEVARKLPMYCLFDPTGDVEKPSALIGTNIPQRRQKGWWNQ